LAKSLKEYFAKFGVELIPFSRDENNWDQLAKVTAVFVGSTPAMFLNEFRKNSILNFIVNLT
jgi:hypothetical protein